METVRLKGYYNKLIPVDTIVYMEGDKGYTKCYYSDGRMVRLSCKIGFANRQLPSFVRIHKSFLVNPAFMQSWSHTDKYWQKRLLLKTGTCLTIAQSQTRAFTKSNRRIHV